MDVRCVLQEKVSEKTGKKYYILYVPDIEKVVFLNQTEIKLLTLLHEKKG